MSKPRQDAWQQEADLLLADIVLRHIREGSTQLNAFEEAGNKMKRTAAACGFRWNAVVRHEFDEQVAEAKEARKEKLKLLGKASRAANLRVLTPTGDEEKRSFPLSALSLDIVIAYLARLQRSEGANSRVEQLHQLTTKRADDLEQRLQESERENRLLRQEREEFMVMMDRARQLVALGQELPDRTQFQMEANGNLVRFEQI